MDNENKDPVSNLEEALKKFWNDYGHSRPVQGVHTTVVVEPKMFLNGTLNPALTDLLLSVYLAQITPADLKSGRVNLKKNILEIKDKYGKLVAEVRKPRMLKEFTARFGL